MPGWAPRRVAGFVSWLERMRNESVIGAEILLVRWGAADGGLLATGKGALRGGFGCKDVWGMVLVWLLASGPVKGEAALHGCWELGE